MGNINEFSEKDEMANCLVHKLLDSTKKFTFDDKFECRVDKTKTVRQFVHLVSQNFNMDVDSFRLVFSSYKSSLMSETRTLHKPSLEEYDDRLLLDIGLIFGKGTVNRFLLSVIGSFGDSDKAVCIVSTVKDKKIYPMEVDKNTTGSQFYKQIFSLCENDDFNTEFFTLIFNSSNQLSKLTITEDDTRLLSDIGVVYRHGVKNCFKIYLKNDVDVHCDESFASCSPLKDQEVEDQSLKVNNSVSPNALDLSSNTKVQKVRPVITRVLRPSTLSQYKYNSGRIHPEFKGLINQAMTCYLNSLLQALYMTPEFRNALYTWKYDLNEVKKERSKSISFQLQQLFLRLQVSPQRSVETTKLTHIFGWSTGDAWLQQDLHEFSRIIIEALEKELQDTTHAEFINELYQGKLIDSIKCLECNSLSSKEQRFLDLPLPIRSFKSNQTYGSLTEVFQGFIEPELLEGVDQYFCEKCNKKCNALKAFEFKKFPYILMMSLLRFSYSSTNRAKVHDRVEFPQVLNLNSFISDNSSSSDNSKESNGLETELFGPFNMSDNNNETQTDSSTSTCDKDENKDKLGNSKTEVAGPYVYDLYAIIIHAGNISGGHYYAYIKDFKSNQWFCFNDQSVTMITMDDIERSFGGQHSKRDNDHNMSSTSAYMLIYRQIDKEKNRYAMSQEEFPPHIKCLQNFFEKTGKFKLRLFSAHSIESDLKSMLFDCNVTTTLRRLKTMAVEHFKITEPCQLVIFDEVTQQICKNLENELNNLVSEVPCFSPRSFLLKIGDNENKNIPKYITMNFVMINLDSKFEVNMPGEVEIEQNKLIEDLSDLLFVKYGIHDDVVLHFVTFIQHFSKLFKIEKSMKCSSVYSNKIFVCMQHRQMSKITLSQKISTTVFQHIYTILLHFVLPEIDTDILQKCKRLNIENSIVGLRESDVSMTLDKLKTVNCNLPIKDKFDCLSPNPQELCNAILGSESIVPNKNNCLNDGDRLVIGDVEMDFPDYECTLVKVDDLDTFREKNNLGAPIDHGDLNKSHLNEKHYFKKLLSPSENNGGFSAYVDKRMNVTELKNHLVPLVNIPFDCITLSVFNSDCTIELVLPRRTLVDLNQCDTVKISIGVPLHDDQYLGTFYWPESLESSKPVMKKMFDWIITAGTSVLDTKQELITKLKKTNDFNIPLERLRFRKKLSNLLTKCYLNDEMWTEHIGQEWEIIVFDLKDRREYELNKTEKLIMICHVANDSDSLGTPISDLEIVVDQVSSTSVNVQLGQMVSKTLKIHEDDLEIGYINDLESVVWKTKTSNWSFDIFNENFALYCRSRQKKLSSRLNVINYNDQKICPNVRCTPTNRSIHSLLNSSVTQFPKKRRSYALNDPRNRLENKKKTVV